MKRSTEVKSICAPLALALILALSAGSPATGAEALRVELAERRIQPGVRTVIVSVYAAPEGGEPIASETRSVRIGETGTFKLPLGDLAAAASGAETRWLSVRVTPGRESRRVALASPAATRDVTVQAVTPSVITGFGIIESTDLGFRFPDGTIQTSAATVSGGVPNVNGIGGAVTIAAGGTASVQTVGSTITLSAPAFGTPVAVGSANAAGAASTIVRSDHVHAHGDQAGGSLHAAATTGSAGFLSATDKQKLDGAASYSRTILVSPDVNDSTASGAALLAALSGITDNNAFDPVLLKLEPGTYDIGASQLTMKIFVDIEGSGEGSTFIVASRGSASQGSTSAAIIAAASSQLRQLTITNFAPGSPIVTGLFTASLSFSLSHVTINSGGGSTMSVGVFATTGSNLTISDATIVATSANGTSQSSSVHLVGTAKATIVNSRITGKGTGGTGVNVGVTLAGASTTATIEGSTILATGTANQNTGVSVAPGTATIMSSTVQVETAGSRAALSTSAQSTAIVNVFHSRLLALSSSSNASEVSVSRGNNSTVRVATSQIDSASNGTPKCVHVYDGDMDDLNNVCPGPVL